MIVEIAEESERVSSCVVESIFVGELKAMTDIFSPLFGLVPSPEYSAGRRCSLGVFSGAESGVGG